MATKKITTGQTIWYYDISEDVFTESIVTKVDDKYFEIKGVNFRFSIDTIEKIDANFRTYITTTNKDELILNLEHSRKLKKALGLNVITDIPLDKLIKMIEILES